VEDIHFQFTQLIYIASFRNLVNPKLSMLPIFLFIMASDIVGQEDKEKQ